MAQAADYFLRAVDLYERKKELDRRYDYQAERDRVDDQYREDTFNETKRQFQTTHDANTLNADRNYDLAVKQFDANELYRQSQTKLAWAQHGIQREQHNVRMQQYKDAMAGIDALLGNGNVMGTFTQTPSVRSMMPEGTTGFGIVPNDRGKFNMVTFDANGNATTSLMEFDEEGLAQLGSVAQVIKDNPDVGPRMASAGFGFTIGPDGSAKFDPQAAIEQAMNQGQAQAAPQPTASPRARVTENNPMAGEKKTPPTPLKRFADAIPTPHNLVKNSINAVSILDKLARGELQTEEPQVTDLPPALRKDAETRPQNADGFYTPTTPREQIQTKAAQGWFQSRDPDLLQAAGFNQHVIDLMDRIDEFGEPRKPSAQELRAVQLAARGGLLSYEQVLNFSQTGMLNYNAKTLEAAAIEGKANALTLFSNYRRQEMAHQRALLKGQKDAPGSKLNVGDLNSMATNIVKAMGTQDKFVGQQSARVSQRLTRTIANLGLPNIDKKDPRHWSLMTDAAVAEMRMESLLDVQPGTNFNYGVMLIANGMQPDDINEENRPRLELMAKQYNYLTPHFGERKALYLMSGYSAEQLIQLGMSPQELQKARQIMGGGR